MPLTDAAVVAGISAGRTRPIEVDLANATDVVFGNVPPPGRDGVPLLDLDLHLDGQGQKRSAVLSVYLGVARKQGIVCASPRPPCNLRRWTMTQPAFALSGLLVCGDLEGTSTQERTHCGILHKAVYGTLVSDGMWVVCRKQAWVGDAGVHFQVN